MRTENEVTVKIYFENNEKRMEIYCKSEVAVKVNIFKWK